MHRDDGSLKPQRWVSERWIYRQAPEARADGEVGSAQLDDGDANLALVFLDEVTALAAGHRPCEVHQASDAKRFLKCWSMTDDTASADWEHVDQTLHRERLNAVGRKETHQAPLRDLPDGSMVSVPAGSCLVLGGRCFLWSTRGYTGQVQVAVDSDVDALTPKSLLDVLRGGYEPDIHESILALL